MTISNTQDLITVLSLIIAVLAMAAALSSRAQIAKLRKLSTALERLSPGDQPTSIAELLPVISQSLAEQTERLKSLEDKHNRLVEQSRGYMQKIGIVRYNAFDNIGADLSFSVAILDTTKSGIVLTCLHGRDESRVYCKPVANGESSYHLSDEEKEAIRNAFRLASGQKVTKQENNYN